MDIDSPESTPQKNPTGVSKSPQTNPENSYGNNENPFRIGCSRINRYCYRYYDYCCSKCDVVNGGFSLKPLSDVTRRVGEINPASVWKSVTNDLGNQPLRS